MKYFFFVVSVLILFRPANAAAASPSIVITEIGAHEASADEWVEIYNPTDAPVDLTGWRFWEDATKHKLSFYRGGSALAAHTYDIIANQADRFAANHPGYGGQIVDSSWSSLKESGEEIGLIDASGIYIEQFTYPPLTTHSLQRIDPLLADYTSNNWIEHATSDSAGRTNEFVTAAPGPDNQQTSEPANGLTDQTANEQPSQPVNEPSEPSNQSTGELATSDPVSETVPEEPILETTAPTTESAANVPIPLPYTVVVNEFVSDPVAGDHEWIELYNSNTFPVDLTGWTVTDGSGTVTTLAGTIGTAVSSPFFTITSPKGALNNPGDIIILKDSHETVYDQVAYGNYNDGVVADNAPATTDPNAVARIQDGITTHNDAADFSVTTTPTKGTTNDIVTPTKTPSSTPATGGQALTASTSSYSPHIEISELFPNPPGDDIDYEFIELHNTGNDGVNLGGWSLSDAQRTEYFFPDGTFLLPGKYAAFDRRETRIALDNDKDTVRLYDQNEKLQDTFAYTDDVPEGISVTRTGKKLYRLSGTPTRAAENIITVVPTAPVPVFDCTTTLPGIVCDGSDSYDRDGDPLTFSWNIGDAEYTGPRIIIPPPKTVTLTVQLKISDGINSVTKTKRITVDTDLLAAGGTYEIAATKKKTVKTPARTTKKNSTAHAATAPPPQSSAKTVALADIAASHVGFRITTEGTVTKVNATSMALSDAGKKIYVHIAATALGAVKAGDRVAVTGTVKKYRTTYQVTPRIPADVTKIDRPQVPAPPEAAIPPQAPGTPILIYLGAAFSAAVAAHLAMKRRRPKPSNPYASAQTDSPHAKIHPELDALRPPRLTEK